jgi:DNA (cytosine-5)-methyltransferase 1
MQEKKYVTVNEAAKLLGVTPLTLRNWDKAGKLVALRNPLNNYRIYKKDDIDFFLRKIESKGKIMMG